MRQPEKKRRTVGIRGQLMWFLCFICLLLLVLFWFLCTQLLEPLYTTHIQKQLTEQADAIVQKLDDAIADGQTLSYWGFGSQLYVNSQFFNQLSSEIYENGGMSSFCVDISDVTLRQIFKVENLSYCNLHRTRPTDENSELPSYSTARAMRQLCRETGSCVRKINPPTPSGTVELMERGVAVQRVVHQAPAPAFGRGPAGGTGRLCRAGGDQPPGRTGRPGAGVQPHGQGSPARGPDAARPAGKCLP